ncbi:MAG: D-erythronate dehydrogenase [Ginsengibacter sp.]
MQIIITGGAGFLGQRLANALLNSPIIFDELLLTDIVMPQNLWESNKIKCQQMDLSEEGAAKNIITSETGIVFHLAAIVSSHAEKDFDLGWKVNLDITRQLLEACRHQRQDIRFVFASSLAVYGGELPDVVSEETVVTPHSSYGSQKAIGEFLVNDYTRKKFIDGRVLRLPTICVRPGKPNLAASSFVSSIIREPVNGESAICPVSPDLAVLLASPDTTIENIIRAATLDATVFGDWRTVNLPGITVTVKEMFNSLERIAGKETVDRIQIKPDPTINNIVSTWPYKVDYTKALKLGFIIDNHFDQIITQFMANNKP